MKQDVHQVKRGGGKQAFLNPATARLLFLFGLFLGSVGVWYLQQRQNILALELGTTQSDQTIVATAGALFCSEGDSSAACDPATGKYSGAATSNAVSITYVAQAAPTPTPTPEEPTPEPTAEPTPVPTTEPTPEPTPVPEPTPTPEQPKFCMKLRSKHVRTSTSFTQVKVEVRSADGDTVLASREGMTSESDGTITITDDTFLNAIEQESTYDVNVKSAGFLTQKVDNVSAAGVKEECYQMTTETAMVAGDFSGNDDKVSIQDVVTAIRHYNNPNDPTTATVENAFPDSFQLPELVTVIRTLNTSSNATK